MAFPKMYKERNANTVYLYRNYFLLTFLINNNLICSNNAFRAITTLEELSQFKPRSTESRLLVI